MSELCGVDVRSHTQPSWQEAASRRFWWAVSLVDAWPPPCGVGKYWACSGLPLCLAPWVWLLTPSPGFGSVLTLLGGSSEGAQGQGGPFLSHVPQSSAVLWPVKPMRLFCLTVTTASCAGGGGVAVLPPAVRGAWALRLRFLVSPSSSWGVCFTYGTWFGLEAFSCMGHTYRNG